MIEPVKPVERIRERAAHPQNPRRAKNRHTTGRPFLSIIKQELSKLKLPEAPNF
jgi:hypothetical protein